MIGDGNTPTAAPGQARAADRFPGLLALTLTVAGGALLLGMALQSTGFYHDDDACHFDFALQGWNSPEYLWSQWGRPGYTLPATLVGHFFGLRGARVLSVLETAGMAYLAYLIARFCLASLSGAEKIAALAPIFVYLQPLTSLLGMTTLTETPAGLYLTLGLYLLLRGNLVWGCAAASLCFITRYELLALAPLLAAAVAYQTWRGQGGDLGKALRQWRSYAAVAALGLGPMIYIVAALAQHLPASSSPLSIFGQHYTNEYGSGDKLTFVYNWWTAAGCGVVALAIAGIFSLPRQTLLPAAVSVGVVALHTLIFMRGSFASGGYPRFLIPISATTAVLAVCGIAGLWRYPKRAGLEAVLALLAASLLLASASAGASTEQSSEYVQRLAQCWGQLSVLTEDAFGSPLTPWSTQGFISISFVLGLGFSLLLLAGGLLDFERLRRRGGIAAVVAIGLAAMLIRLLLWDRLSAHMQARYGNNLPDWGVGDFVLAVLALWLIFALMYAGLKLLGHERLRLWQTALATTAAGLAIFMYGAGTIKPLRIDDPGLSPLNPVIHAALRETALGPYRNQPAITAHVVPPLLRANTRSYYARDALGLWLDAPPGTLFIWDSKYAASGDENDKLNLDLALETYGSLVGQSELQEACVRVFARSDQPLQAPWPGLASGHKTGTVSP